VLLEISVRFAPLVPLMLVYFVPVVVVTKYLRAFHPIVPVLQVSMTTAQHNLSASAVLLKAVQPATIHKAVKYVSAQLLHVVDSFVHAQMVNNYI
jgi:hypothetical protein